MYRRQSRWVDTSKTASYGIERIPILPLLQEEKAIAHILGTLDDKIELNRKTNEPWRRWQRRSSSRGLWISIQ